jgi:hypothetical protein
MEHAGSVRCHTDRRGVGDIGANTHRMSANAQKALALRYSLTCAQFVFQWNTAPRSYDVGFAVSLTKQE